MRADANGTAPDGLGNYNRAAVAWLEGSYLTIRPSFGERGAVYAYRTDISWDDATSTLVFRELERTDKDYAQFGSVAVPHQSGHIYLVTNRHGQHRLIVVARPTIQGEMHGLLTTLQSGRGAHLSPVATPIVLKTLKAGAQVHYGRIAPGHAHTRPIVRCCAKRWPKTSRRFCRLRRERYFTRHPVRDAATFTLLRRHGIFETT